MSSVSKRTGLLIGVVALVAVVAVALALAVGRAGSTSASGSASTEAAATSGALIVGTLLPATGELASLGAPEFAGVRAAVSAINEAGGVLGMPVQTIEGDSGNKSELASLTLKRATDQGAQVIIGPATSGLTLAMLGQTTAAGVVAFSPSSTSITLSDPVKTQGLFFRTVAPDTYQGSVLADLAFNEGKRSVAIMQVDDEYGDGLGVAFTLAFEKLGGKVVAREVYNPDATSFTDQVKKVKATAPDGIALFGFSESTTVISELIAAGIGPQEVTLYLCDGNMANSLATGLPSGTLDGVEGTIPGAAVDSEMQATLLAANPKLTSFEYGPESYDTAIITALAAESAGSVLAAEIAAQIPIVTALGNTPCTTYAACLELLKAGKAISYQGPSGAQALRANGDPSVAVMGIWVFAANGQISPLKQVSGDVPLA